MVEKTGETQSSKARAAASSITRSNTGNAMGFKASQHATTPQPHTSFA
jgi:hypothetical protein